LTSANAVRSRQTIRFRGLSFVAFVLAPTPPVTDWLDELDRWRKTSPDFFVGRPTILNISGLPADSAEVAGLVTSLAERGIRIIGLDGAEGHQLDPSLPPPLKGGRPAAETPADEAKPSQPAADAAATAAARNEPSTLLIEHPIRSGQSVTFPYGDITVLGAVSSGAEVVAAGSIHIYGALRGRAMAGAMGNAKARIFCSRNEAELIAIDGYYRTAEDMASELRGKPVQCRLDDRTLVITALSDEVRR
jgi:septum site-determining protein MinC